MFSLMNTYMDISLMHTIYCAGLARVLNRHSKGESLRVVMLSRCGLRLWSQVLLFFKQS